MTEHPSEFREQPRSIFGRKLAADPELARRCEEVVDAYRRAAEQELRAVERSTILTAEDFHIMINARAEGQ